jgi:hypothetical protein
MTHKARMGQIQDTYLVDENDNNIGSFESPIHVQGIVGITITVSVDPVEMTDVEGLGDISVGTSEVQISITGTPTQIIRIQADDKNTGLIFVGKSGILSDKTNDVFRLEATEEAIISYNDVSNALYAISNLAGQTINVGALL